MGSGLPQTIYAHPRLFVRVAVAQVVAAGGVVGEVDAVERIVGPEGRDIFYVAAGLAFGIAGGVFAAGLREAVAGVREQNFNAGDAAREKAHIELVLDHSCGFVIDVPLDQETQALGLATRNAKREG
jgi:hypothetical protein